MLKLPLYNLYNFCKEWIHLNPNSEITDYCFMYSNPEFISSHDFMGCFLIYTPSSESYMVVVDMYTLSALIRTECTIDAVIDYFINNEVRIEDEYSDCCGESFYINELLQSEDNLIKYTTTFRNWSEEQRYLYTDYMTNLFNKIYLITPSAKKINYRYPSNFMDELSLNIHKEIINIKENYPFMELASA